MPGFGEDEARLKTVAAQPVVLKALAKLVFDFAFSNRRPENSEELLERVLDGITEIDFSHQHPLWQYFDLSPAERVTRGLSELALYLPEDDRTVNRDIGKGTEHMRVRSFKNAFKAPDRRVSRIIDGFKLIATYEGNTSVKSEMC
jgi:hypothetical protein